MAIRRLTLAQNFHIAYLKSRQRFDNTIIAAQLDLFGKAHEEIFKNLLHHNISLGQFIDEEINILMEAVKKAKQPLAAQDAGPATGLQASPQAAASEALSAKLAQIQSALEDCFSTLHNLLTEARGLVAAT